MEDPFVQEFQLLQEMVEKQVNQLKYLPQNVEILFSNQPIQKHVMMVIYSQVMDVALLVQ